MLLIAKWRIQNMTQGSHFGWPPLVYNIHLGQTIWRDPTILSETDLRLNWLNKTYLTKKFISNLLVFYGFGQAKFPVGGLVLGSSQFSILPQLPAKIMLDWKVVKIDPKIIVTLCLSKSVAHSVPSMLKLRPVLKTSN